jgi:hypothetical protein
MNTVLSIAARSKSLCPHNFVERASYLTIGELELMKKAVEFIGKQMKDMLYGDIRTMTDADLCTMHKLCKENKPVNIENCYDNRIEMYEIEGVRFGRLSYDFKTDHPTYAYFV